MDPLPIDGLLDDITASLRQDPSLVIVAPPGARKTTRVAPALLRSGVVPRALIMLQPRRVAARAAARRIAEENGWTLGDEVGYQVRFERKLSPITRGRSICAGPPS